MPFKYTEAPILVYNGGRGDFPLIEQFARQADRTTPEGGLSSRLRSRTRPLPTDLANEVIRIYESLRADASPLDIASTYDEALPHDPPHIDRNRRATYQGRISELTGDPDGLEKAFHPEVPPSKDQPQSRCAQVRPRQLQRNPRRCT